MSIWKKAISVGTSAALLASLLTAMAAPAAFASTTVTGVGSVGRDQTSTTAASFLFTENSADDLDNASNFDVYIFDSAGDCTVLPGVGVNVAAATVTFVGPATISAPGSLGASVTLGSNSFNVKWTAFNDLDVETILIGGLKIKAAVGAATGAIKACVYETGAGAVAGTFADAFASDTATANGKLVGAVGVGSAAFAIALDTGSCPFDSAGGATVARPLKIAGANPEDITSATIAALAGGQHAVSAVTPVTTKNHLANDVVTQTVNNCSATTLGSPGSVVDSLDYKKPAGQTTLFPGENNQWVNAGGAAGGNDLFAAERNAGFLKKDATITLTISTAGVTFSQAPKAFVSVGNLVVTGAQGVTPDVFGVLSADKKAVTWTVSTASTAASTIQFWAMRYDVAATVTSGTKVDITLATSAGAVEPTSRSNAVVGRVLSVTATSPVVYIGENNQTAGQVTIVETGPGFFVAGTGLNNTLALCLNSGESFASAPWAKVTAGDLKLREGDVVSPDNVVQGKPAAVSGVPFPCYYWTVWTASTAASTIVISGDEAGTAGVKINVPFGLGVGPVYGGVRTGDIASLSAPVTQAQVTIGTRAFRSQVAVTALSQPTIPVGSNGALAGDIQIQETASGQLKAGETICVDIVPNQNWYTLYDVFLKALNTADRPLVTASNGIVVSGVSVSSDLCAKPSISAPGLVASFYFKVEQQSITGNGKIVISNIKYATVNDAVEGPVQVNVYGAFPPAPPTNNGPVLPSGTQIEFQSIISNARIGGPFTLSIGAVSALGLNPTSGYTTKTPKVQVPNKYITWKFTGGKTLANQRVNILVALRINGAWGGPQYLVSRTADANGIVTFYWKAPAGTVLNIRAQWPGNANYNKSTSPALGAHWK